MKNILFLLLGFCFFTSLRAQVSETLPTHYLLYSLNEQDVLNYRNGKFDPKELIQKSTPVDSVLKSTNSYAYLLAKRSFGYFLMVNYGTDGIEMSMMLVSPVRINAFRFEDVWQVYVNDSTGFVKDFTLETEKQSYSPSTHCQCIEIKSKKLPKGNITIHHGKQFYVINKNDFAPNYGNGGKVYRDRFAFLRRNRGPFEAGFIVLNQSEYRHLDSFHVKAFLMDRKGRPIEKNVTIEITAPNNMGFYRQTFEAKKLSSGAFSLDWQIPDSLQLDQTYTITFYAQGKSAAVKSTTFRVTHYDFKNYKITVRQTATHLLPNDSAFIKISATDQNDIPLPGTKVEMRFYLSETGTLHIPYMGLADSFYTRYKDTLIYLEPEKETWFRVPQELLQSIDHNLNVEVKVSTPNNEIQTEYLSFKATQELKEYGTELAGDTLHLFLKRNRIKIASDSVTIRLTDRFFYEIQDFKTKLPYSIPNLPHYALVQVLDSNGALLINYTTQMNWVAVSGIKTRDSLYVHFRNGSLYHLQWELYRNGKRFLQGNADSIVMPLKGTEPVQVLYRYLNGSQLFYGQQVVIPSTQELKIVHNLPAVAYPGQTVVAELTVYDFEGKPVKNANITGVSINSQMPVINPPEIPYFPKIKGKSLALTPMNFSFPGYSYLYFAPRDSAHYRKLALERYLHYRIYNSPEGFHQEVLESKKGITQLQVLVYETNTFQIPREIWVDGQIQYMILGGVKQRNALRITPGKHKIAIRTPNYFIELDSVWFEADKHTILGFNELHLDASTRLKFQRVNVHYELQELEKIEENALLLSFKGHTENSWIRQDSNIYEVPGPFIFLRHAIDYAYYTHVAPIKEGMVEWFTRDTSISFYFNPELLYTIDSGRIVTNAKTQLSLGHANYAHTSGYFQSDEVLTYAELQRRWFVEDSLAEVNKNRKRIAYPEQSYYGNQFVAYQQYGGTSGLTIQYGKMTTLVSDFIWLENRNDPKHSIYLQNQINYLSNIKPGLYRMVTGRYQQEMLEVDSLLIDTLSRAIIRLDLLAKPLEPAHWALMQYNHIQTINKYGNAGTPLYDAYTLKQESTTSNSKCEVNGTALVNLGPASNAYIVFIHQNGQNRYLATANDQGHFRQYDMEAGRYWVQVISAYRHVFFANEITLRPGTLLTLQLDGITDTSLIKKISPSFHQKRFNRDSAIYLDEEGQFASMEGRVYNVETKLPLANAQIRISLNGVIIGGARTNSEGYYQVSFIKPGKYQVEVLQSGYQNLLVKDTEFKKGKRLKYNYALLESEHSETYQWAFGNEGRDVLTATQKSVDYYTSYDEAETYSASPLHVQSVATGAYRQFNVLDGIASVGKSKKEEAIDDLEESIDEKARLDEISRDPSANRIRKEFQTNAFWVPNLITGKDGKTAFTYTLPDDQTQWINFLVAINRKQQTNRNTSYTRSYKPLSASLRVPLFVVAGDKITLSGTVRNLTGDSLQLVIRETLNGITEKQRTSTVGGYLRETDVLEVPLNKDTLTLSYTLEYGNYIDGEQRKIPVLSNKVYDRKVQTRIVGTGEQVQLSFNLAATRKSVRLQSGLRDLLEEEINALKGYEYGCVEQTASKLFALLREMQLRRALGEEFKDKQEIVALIKRLESFQNQDGGWGWWKGSSSDVAITVYVSKALALAETESFGSRSFKRGVGMLVNQFPSLKNEHKLAALLLAKELDMKLDYTSPIQDMAKKNLNIEARMSLIELQIKMGLPYDLQPILKALSTSGRGYVFMTGESSWGFNAHLISLSMQAYHVLRLAGGHESTLLSMRKFLFDNLSYVSRNTFERAAIINTLTEEIQATGGALFQVKLGNETLYTGGTYTVSGENITVENLGAGISVIAIEEYESDAPTKQTNGIHLQTQFDANGKATYQVSAGDITPLHVIATVSEYQKYVVLRVPIPAGCQIIDKPQAVGNETAREYFSDHIVIYFESLTKGEYHFYFQLLPQFEGTLTLMPAMMENMYKPEVFGREMKRVVTVGP